MTETATAPKFTKGQRVAHSHIVATEHDEDSKILASAVRSRDPKAAFGTIVGPHESPAGHVVPNWFDVDLDAPAAAEGQPAAAPTRVTLTFDELVRIKE